MQDHDGPRGCITFGILVADTGASIAVGMAGRRGEEASRRRKEGRKEGEKEKRRRLCSHRSKACSETEEKRESKWPWHAVARGVEINIQHETFSLQGGTAAGKQSKHTNIPMMNMPRVTKSISWASPGVTPPLSVLLHELPPSGSDGGDDDDDMTMMELMLMEPSGLVG